jgi:hypothetical protein
LLPRGSGNWCRRRKRMLSDVDWRRSVLLHWRRQGCLRRLSLEYFGRKFGSQRRRGKVLLILPSTLSLVSYFPLRDVSPCRLVTRPQGGQGAPSSPSRTRSPEPQVMGEALADDARTATPPRGAAEGRVASPPVAYARVGTPPHAADAEGASAGDVGATTSLAVINVDPISAVPGGTNDLVGDQP